MEAFVYSRSRPAFIVSRSGYSSQISHLLAAMAPSWLMPLATIRAEDYRAQVETWVTRLDDTPAALAIGGVGCHLAVAGVAGAAQVAAARRFPASPRAVSAEEIPMMETFYRYDGVNPPLWEILPRCVRANGAGGAGVTGAA